MPPYARSHVVEEGKEGVYLIHSRCAAEAWLDGVDSATGKQYRHRRRWVADQVRGLQNTFAVDVLGWSVEPRSLHLVLACRPKIASKWSNQEVVWRWFQVFGRTQGPLDRGKCRQLAGNDGPASVWRDRLSSVSWFMRVFNEGIARKANQEDARKGRFWSERFYCQAVDAAALAGTLAALPGYRPKASPVVEKRPSFPGLDALPPPSPGAKPAATTAVRKKSANKSRRMTADEQAEAYRRVQAGEPRGEVAKAMGVSWATISLLVAKVEERGGIGGPRLLSSEVKILKKRMRTTPPPIAPVAERRRRSHARKWTPEQIHRLAEQTFKRPLYLHPFEKKDFLDG